jgi:hypothetical protein
MDVEASAPYVSCTLGLSTRVRRGVENRPEHEPNEQKSEEKECQNPSLRHSHHPRRRVIHVTPPIEVLEKFHSSPFFRCLKIITRTRPSTIHRHENKSPFQQRQKPRRGFPSLGAVLARWRPLRPFQAPQRGRNCPPAQSFGFSSWGAARLACCR